MKERSLVERIVAIVGVLAGTVVWVARLLFSLLKGLLKGGSSTDEQAGGEANGSRSGQLAGKGESLLHEARERGETLLDDVREKGERLVDEARERVDEVRHRGEEEHADEGSGGAHFTAAGTATTGDADVSSTQHDDLGGVPDPRTGAVAAASLSSMDAVYDREATGAEDDDEDDQGEQRVSSGIPNLQEPDESDDGDMYGSESGSLMGEDRGTGYAGQAMSESDIGVEREDSVSELADSPDRPAGGFDQGWVSDEVNLDRSDTEPTDVSFDGEEYGSRWIEDQIDPVQVEASGEEFDQAWVSDQVDLSPDRADETDEDEDEVAAASRGWDEPEDDVLKDDPLYGDFETSGTGGEVDLRNDEADEDDDAGMHIIDSPDERFIEDEDASASMGFAETGTAEEIDVDEIGEERVALSEDNLAANALGQPAGDSAASGDLGPEESPDDARWDPDASRPDYDVLGARDGSGVDEFADDTVAEEMLSDVTEGETGASEGQEGTGASGEDSTGGQSVAWATTAGVIDPDLAKPMSADELQAEDADSGGTEDGEPGTTEEDAGLRDVASDVAEGLDQEPGDRETATGTTMSGAGQSAGAMTSDDAANDDRGANEMTTDTGSVETGGAPASEAGDAQEDESGESDEAASMGVAGSGQSFDDILPETAYQKSVGYEPLRADEEQGSSPEEISGDAAITVSTSATGEAGVSRAMTEQAERDGGKGAPAGAVRGDGSRTCPDDFPIKGNASSHIYHRPGDSSYDNTIPEFCFATEADAKAAGFRPRRGGSGSRSR